MSKYFALALCAMTSMVTAASHPQEARPVIRTPLGTSSAQVLLAKITVSDLPRSYEFYSRLVGLQWALAPGQAPPPTPVPANDSQPAFIEIPMNFSGSLADPFFVLVQRRGDKPTPEVARMSWVGFKVPDAPAAVRRIKEAGYEVVREPLMVGAGEMSIGIIRDPDGYSVELIQSASYQAPSAMPRTNPAELPKVFAVRITVSDLARSEQFYRDGLGAQIRQIRPGESMAQFITGPGVVLALGQPDAKPQTGGPGGFLLQVVDLDAAVARVTAAGGTIERAPSAGANSPSGVRSAFIRDPDGVGIEVIQFPH